MIALQGAALAGSLLHALVDVWLGLFGTGPAIRPGQAATLVAITLLYCWWALLLSFAGRRDVLFALAALAGIWGAVANGLVGLAACFVPCAGAFPLGDFAHLASLIFGAWAALATVRAAGTAAGPGGWGVLGATLVLLAAAFAFQAANATVGSAP